MIGMAGILANPAVASAQPAPSAASPPAATAPAAAETRRFPVEEYRVEGNTVLPAALIEEAVYPFLGPDRTADDVEHARAALDALYAQKGYPTVSAEVPAQDPSTGVITLKVIERKIGRLRVRGSRYFSLRAIKDSAPALAEGRVPDMNAVQRDIVALNQWPDRVVTPVLRPGIAPGTVDVDLNVKDTFPLHGSVELNNKQSQSTTALRSVSSVSYGNLWQRGDSVSLSWQTAPLHGSDSGVISGSYLYRIPNSNMSLLASLVKSESDVATVGGTDVIGRGTIMGLRLLVPLGQEGSFTHSLSLGFDYKHFDDATVLGGDRSPAPITYMPLNVTWQASWSGEHEAATDASVSFVMGTRGLGSSQAQFDVKRYNARPNFAYLRGDVSRTQPLPWGFQGYVKAAGQATNEPLISSEQFGVGGVDTVRGYFESEAIGDYGIAAQAELRSPSAGELLSDFTDTRAFAFADAGRVGIHQPLAEQNSGRSLTSVGGGVRLRGYGVVGLDVIGAHVLSPGAISHAGSSRLLFRLNGAF